MALDTVTAKPEPPAPPGVGLRADPMDRPPGTAPPRRRRTRSWRDRARAFFRVFRPRPFRTLSRRIVGLNLVGLAVLVGGILYLSELRAGMLELRVRALEGQGAVIAAAIAQDAALPPAGQRYDAQEANLILRKLLSPENVRAQVFDRSGRMTGDTRNLFDTEQPVEEKRLPPIKGPEGVLAFIEELYSRAVRTLLVEAPPLYNETPFAAITQDREVYDAVRTGEPQWALRANSKGEEIVSVAVPIKRIARVMGVLVLSTKGGDIDKVISAGRVEILRVFLVASAVSLALSILLASTIGRPLERLAAAAERGRSAGRDPSRVRIPDFTSRGDEIGHLSGAMRRMTEALYKRIEAIESFAADVAHEIKNPLTSLRSAVETMRVARTDQQRERLLGVIEHDVARLDRLVTDISNASRLDAELVREERERFDFAALITAVTDVSAPVAAKRDIRIRTSLPRDPLWVNGLESRLAQVLSNLIDNGISFSPRGGALQITAWHDPDGAVTVCVDDQGPGIPPDNVETIFERFYTERPESEAFGDHSGLGLSISRQIVQAHGGSIWAANRPEGGARFQFRLPP